MKEKSFILKIVKSIERKFDRLIVWAYRNSNENGTYCWWEIAVSNYDVYTDNKFKKIMDVWYKIANRKGIKIIFCCGWIPKEKQLVSLQEKDLILNIKKKDEYLI